MKTLANLCNISRPKQKTKRLGRGPGSGLGKTCGRGHKGSGSRSGYKRRLGYEGGQFRTHMKLPIRGFSNAVFKKTFATINLGDIEKIYQDGEVVSAVTLHDKGFIGSPKEKVKVLGNGTLNKKVTFEVDAVSEGAKEKLRQANIAV